MTLRNGKVIFRRATIGLTFSCWIWINRETVLSKNVRGHLENLDSVQYSKFSCSVKSDSLWPHESQHSRPPCPSPTPRVHSNSRPSSQWCHLAISSSVVPFSSCPQALPASVFSNESTLRMRWPRYWSFSFSIIPSKEHPGLLQNGLVGSPCSPRDFQESSPTPQLKSINSLVLGFLHSPTLTSIHDRWKNHSLD